MRKSLVLLSVFVFLLAFSGLAEAVITQSKHDFTQAVGANVSVYPAGQQLAICDACHVPHKGLSSVRYRQGLLWQQTVREGQGGVSLWATGAYWYTGWQTADTTISPVVYSDLDVGSRRCLGCHDGRTFYLWLTYARGGGIERTAAITAGGARFQNLTEAHPVGIKYDPTFYGSDFETKITAMGKGIKFVNKTTGGPGDYLGCGSCHDPHNRITDGSKFVRASLTGSALCLACHKK